MPKSKRGRRHHHYRVKNYERKCQNQKPMQDVANTITVRPDNETTSSFFQQLTASSDLSERLPAWHIYKHTNFMEFSLLDVRPPHPSVVKISLTLTSNLHWSVKVYGKLCSISTIYNNCPVTIRSFENLYQLCKFLNEANVCHGNNDDTFIELLKSREGTIRNVCGSVVAYLDASNNTVRHQNCTLLCDGLKCQNCHQYRASLRALVSKSNKQNTRSKTDSSSHANYRYLQPHELTARLKNVQKAKRNAERNVARLKEKLNNVIEKEGIDLVEEDVHELEEAFAHSDKEVSKLNREHFHRIFWDQQRAYNKLSNKRRMRWHPLMVRFALNLKYLSSTAYRSLQQFIALPSQRTLCDYTHVMKVNSGVSIEMINRLKQSIQFKDGTPSAKKFGILLDEMKMISF